MFVYAERSDRQAQGGGDVAVPSSAAAAAFGRVLGNCYPVAPLPGDIANLLRRLN